jgi:hypothetical protein
MRGDVAAVGLVLALGAAGCFSPAPATGLPCSADGECPAGQTCNMATSPPTCDGVTQVDAPDVDPIDGPRADAQSCAVGCPDTAPVCDVATGQCRGCVADAECETGACYETDGTCVMEELVLFVAPGGAGGECSRVAPCATLSGAMTLSTATRAFIAVEEGTYADNLLAWPTYRVVVSGPDRDPEDAVIEQAVAGMAIVDVADGAISEIEGMTFTGAAGAVGLRCRGACTVRRIVSSYNGNRGFDVYSTAEVFVEDSVFEHNGGIGVDANGRIVMNRTISAHNGDSGVNVANGYYEITNSFFFSNGNGMTPGGGVVIGGGVGMGSRFEFNTVVDNRALDATRGGGLHCSPASGTATIGSSIFARNSAPNVLLSNPCVASYVLTSAGTVPGTGNLVAEPSFVDEMAEDFHITNTSPARAAADPDATLGSDCDGEPRPAPVGSRRDIGADEVP